MLLSGFNAFFVLSFFYYSCVYLIFSVMAPGYSATLLPWYCFRHCICMYACNFHGMCIYKERCRSLTFYSSFPLIRHMHLRNTEKTVVCFNGRGEHHFPPPKYFEKCKKAGQKSVMLQDKWREYFQRPF